MAKASARASGPGGSQAGEPLAPEPRALSFLRSLDRFHYVGLAGVAAVMFSAVLIASVKPVDWPNDSFSDMNVIMEGENFYNVGFFKLRFLPVPYVPAGGKEAFYYTHFPPLPDLMNGVMRHMGIGSLEGWRIACGLLGIAGFVMIYCAFRPVIGSGPMLLGLLLIATSGYYFLHCVSIHQHNYNWLFLGAFFLCFLRWLDSPRPRWLAVGAWTALFLEAWTSFEFIVYAQVFLWVIVLARGEVRKRFLVLCALAAAPVLAVALHFLQNVWAMGGWGPAIADGMGYGQYGGENRIRELYALPENLFQNSVRYFFWPWATFVVVGALVAGVLSARQEAAGPRKLLGALMAATAIAPLFWYLGMAAHAHHPGTISQMVPLYILGMGGAASMLLAWLFTRGLDSWKRVLAVLALGTLVFGQYQSLEVRKANGFLPNALIAEALGPSSFPERSGVIFNTAALAQASYYLRHASQLCPRAGLPFPESLPFLRNCVPEGWQLDSYLYFGPGDPQLLYLLMSNCPGKKLMIGEGRFVALFDISKMAPDARPAPLGPGVDLNRVNQAQMIASLPDWELPQFWQRVASIQQRYR